MNPFNRLAPFIQEFIYRSGWDELRDVQTEAIRAILDTDQHVLITSGTASGKTEAAFFPILTALTEKPAESLGVMYIGPLKALINDQFERIQALIEEAELPVYAWHGDRSASEKHRAMKAPCGILQITPESLEALLMNHRRDAMRIFADLRFIIIDELHAFLGTDRGLQLQCLLTRIDRLIGHGVRRVGLSATIQDTGVAGAWLAAGSERTAVVIASTSGGKKLNLSLRHDELPADEDSPAFAAQNEERFRYLYEQVSGRKCLVFTNSRMDAESTAAKLSGIAQARGEADIFRVHHGSISGAMRGETEEALRSSDRPAVVVTTKTLELGIDLGALDRVVQIGTPSTCSSFVQRLGRSGRRGTPAVMRFLTAHQADEETPMAELPWELIQNIAIIQLYLEERWVEGFDTKTQPFSLLFHQTLSALMSAEMTGRELAQSILTLPPFRQIAPVDYRTLLDFMLETDMIEKTENGALIPGLAGEKLAGNYRFYSVFQDNEGYRVFYRQHALGEIDDAPDPGKTILLGGRAWRVEEIDEDRRAIYVVPHHGRVKKQWHGGAASLDERVVKKMRDILCGTEEYAYLQPNASKALTDARNAAKAYQLHQSYTVLDDHHWLLHPWLGSHALETLYFLLQHLPDNVPSAERIHMVFPVALLMTSSEAPETWLPSACRQMAALPISEMAAFAPKHCQDRYDSFLPETLRQKSVLYNELDIPGVQQWCREQ